MLEPGADRLAVWLHGRRVATLRHDAIDRVSLAYDPPAVAEHEGGILLSAALPVRAEPYPPDRATPWVEGVLPEGHARSLLETRFAVPRGDAFDLLANIGEECAGAVAFTWPDDPPPGPGRVERLPPDDLAARVARLPSHPLGMDGAVRVSLAGLQGKLVLVRLPGGGWGLPVQGAPSTHIVKPEPDWLPGSANAEALAAAVAAAAGVPAVDAGVEAVAGRPVLVVRRYDRVVGPGGTVRRLHQEDACQAAGLDPRYRYASDGEGRGPTLALLAQVVRQVSARPRADLLTLARLATVNVLLGNTDAHARNHALLYGPGGPRLAPAYDLLPVAAMWPHQAVDGLALPVNGVSDPSAVTRRDLVAEARTWRVPQRLAEEAVGEAVQAAAEAVDEARARWPLPAHAVDAITSTARRLHRG